MCENVIIASRRCDMQRRPARVVAFVDVNVIHLRTNDVKNTMKRCIVQGVIMVLLLIKRVTWLKTKKGRILLTRCDLLCYKNLCEKGWETRKTQETQESKRILSCSLNLGLSKLRTTLESLCIWRQAHERCWLTTMPILFIFCMLFIPLFMWFKKGADESNLKIIKKESIQNCPSRSIPFQQL